MVIIAALLSFFSALLDTTSERPYCRSCMWQPIILIVARANRNPPQCID